MIRWFARNDIAANFVMFGILLCGIWSAIEKVPLEVQPSITFKEVRVMVEYRGGSPEDVESGVVVPIESALEGLGGIAEINSRISAGSGEVRIIASDDTDTDKLLDEVKSRVDAITSFPQEIEPPRIQIPDTTQWFDVIKIAITGDMDEADLVKAARRVRDDLIEMPGISQASVQGETRQEISIEADLARLRDFGLGFNDLSEAVRRSSLDLPAGQIQTDEGNLTIRSKGQAYEREQFESIVVRNQNGGRVLLRDVAKVGDGFEENRKLLRFNGKPALLVEALRLHDENALDIAAKAKNYVATQHERFPKGIELHIWDDSSRELEGRIGTLLTSLAQGGLLVMIVLGLFLRPSIAFWVALGIPISFAGGLIAMPFFGLSANMMTIFGFIIVIGIVVDDAIVTSENVYTKLRSGMDPLDAAVEGTREVAVPVTFGALTTIVAFIPLMFFDGFYGNFTRQVPPIVAAVLVTSLIESKIALPAHLKHIEVGRTDLGPFARFQKSIADGLETFVDRFYQPSLQFAVTHRYATIAAFLAIGMACAGIFSSGRLGFTNMPAIDKNRIIADVRMPRDTSVAVTDERVDRIVAAVDRLRNEFIDPVTGKSLIEDVLTSSGGWSGWGGFDPRQGYVVLSVTDPGLRGEPGPKNSVIAKRWKELVGELPDAQSFAIFSDRGGGFRGGGDDLQSLEIELRGPASELRDRLAEEIAAVLESYPGIADAFADVTRGQNELHLTLKPEGSAIGLTQADLARQVRSAFFGDQAQRVQRGRDDIRVMVRLPLDQRQSLQTLEQLRILTPDGGNAPFHAVADARFVPTRSEIRRIDGAQVIEISARPSDESVDVVAIARDISPRLDAILNPHPELSWRLDGYVAEHEETSRKTIAIAIGLFVALYGLLAVPFKSMLQPFIVMLAIPFGIIGALAGHMIRDITPSFLSIFGILALAGVVVNDSIVLVDFINQRRAAGDSLLKAVIDSGARRFRPILLTSLTTFAGLLPLILDDSIQNAMLVPMAVSLGFGLLFATFITLYLIPTSYLVMEESIALIKRSWLWYRRPFSRKTSQET
ncbi:MAG: efflux RND transporter permease subunit [Verrucomicrobia bacterium]|nr:MAG: efflux RND transporter permease subunit [Verrucomicrobiota bacterium]TAE87640.1 MAG: efflux RND transporter permease subunit [Verrucomicrobiota bacterium]TAF25425.1 MAG: efflux RND transporter permease subunit [Verrucomicrobiota bacterium]TAF41212.1 MAG: efflux RND transporter permease subunit [Verrucomicrobiota bacterium]